MEAGSPYDKFYGEHAAEFTKATGVDVAFNAIPHDSIRQQFAQDALSGAGGFDVYIADQVWLPEFAEKGFIVDLTDKLDATPTRPTSPAARSRPCPGRARSLRCRSSCTIAPCTTAPISSRRPGSRRRRRPGTNIANSPRSSQQGPGVWGTLIVGKQDIEASTRLHSFNQQAGGDILDANDKPTIDSDAGHKALEFMTKVDFTDQSAPPGVLELSDTQGMWLDGKLALAAGLAVPLLAVQGAARRQVRRSTPHPAIRSRWHGLFVGLLRRRRLEEPRRGGRVGQMVDRYRQLDNFGKNWINPVPRTSAIDKVQADPSISEPTRRPSPPSPRRPQPGRR